MFAISGMKLFRNKFGYCGSPDTFFVNQEQVINLKINFLFLKIVLGKK